MSGQPESLPYTQLPNRGGLVTRLLDATPNDVKILLPGLAATVAMSMLVGLGVTFLMLILMVGLLYRYPYGRGYSMLYEAVDSWFIRNIRRGKLWDPDPNAKLVKRLVKRALWQRQLFDLSPQVIEARGQRIAVLHDEKKKLDHLYIVAEGSNASALDIHGYQQVNLAVAETIKHVKAETGLSIGVSFGRLIRPYDATELATFFRRNLHPDVAVPESFVTPENQLTRDQRVEAKLHAVMQQVAEVYTPVVANVTFMAVITVKRPSKWRKRKMMKKGLSEKDLYNAPIARMARTFVTDLEQVGVKDARWLGMSELTALFRRSHDVAHLDEYYTARAEGLVPKKDDDIQHNEHGVVTSELRYLPEGKVAVGKDWINIGGTLHRTLRITQLPQQVLPNLIHVIYGATSGNDTTVRGWSAISLSGETISGQAEYRRFTWGMTLRRSLNRARGQKIYRPPSDRDKERDLERRQTDMYRSGSVGQKCNIFATVSGSTLEEVEEMQHQVEKVIRGRSGRIQVVRGESRQLRAMQTATMAANQM